MTEKTDYELLNGDYYEFAELYSRYSTRISGFLFLYKLVRNNSDTDDILQLIWIRVYTNRDKYDSQWAFSTWVSRLAFRVALNFYRDQKILPLVTNSPNLERTIDHREVRDTLVVAETQKRVREAIENLPGNAKEAIEKVYFSDMRFATAQYHQGYKRGRRILKRTLAGANNGC